MSQPAPTIYLPGKAPAPRGPQPVPGRRQNQLRAGFIDGYVATERCIWLCWRCAPFFRPPPPDYYEEKAYLVGGNCDNCKTFARTCHFFVHERWIAAGTHRPA